MGQWTGLSSFQLSHCRGRDMMQRGSCVRYLHVAGGWLGHRHVQYVETQYEKAGL